MASIDLPGDTSDYWGKTSDPYRDTTTNPSMAGTSSAPQGQTYLTPGYTPPPPGQAANGGIPNVPRPSVNPSVVYTDAQGNGYDPIALNAAYQRGAFANDPTASRIPDILSQYAATGGMSPDARAAAAGGGSPSGYSGTSIFSDPATQQYEQLLNGIIGKLNTPYTAPDYQSTLDALKSYIQRLNGPAYTPDQMDLLQTQVFDPLMAQRDAAEQQIIQRFAAQGMGPSSGPVQQAILQNRQKYEQMGTQARAGVASQAIGLQNQNQANAATLQTQLPALETNANTYNNQNALQAANLAGIIPNMAWSRLTGAQNATSGLNPLSALQLLLNAQQNGANNGAQYSAALQSVLPYLLGLFGVK